MAPKSSGTGVLLGWNDLQRSMDALTRTVSKLSTALGGSRTSTDLFAGIRGTPTSALAQQAVSPTRTTPHPSANFAANPLSRAGWQNRASHLPVSPMVSSVFGGFGAPQGPVPNGGLRQGSTGAVLPSFGQPVQNGGLRLQQTAAGLLHAAGKGFAAPAGNGGHTGGGVMLPPGGGASVTPPGNGGHQPGALRRMAPLAAAGALTLTNRTASALANYGDERMADMTAMELAAASAGLYQSGTPLAGRTTFLNQAFGPNATSPSNAVALDQADAVNAVLARMRTSGSLALSTPRDQASDRAWRSLGMVVGNASFSATDAATAAAQIQSPQFQHRAAALGLGSTFDPDTHSFVGNAELARRMLFRATGTATPTQERLAAGLQEGGKLRYMLGNTGWSGETTEQFTSYMAQLVDLQQRGMDPRRVDTLLAQASDKSNPQYQQARDELTKFGWTETQFQKEKDLRALDRSGDAAVFEQYIDHLKKATKAVEDWTTFIKAFLDLPPIKAIVSTAGAIAKYKENPGALLSLPVTNNPVVNPVGLNWSPGFMPGGGLTTHVPQAGPDDGAASGGKRAPNPNKDKQRSTDNRRRNQDQAPSGGGVSAAIAFARQQLGEPYLWGATGPNAWDCSGLTQQAYAAAGKKIGRTTWDQVKNGVPVARDPKKWRPGDLIFPDPGHVVMWLGNGQYIHAPRKNDVVRIVSGIPKAYAVRRIMGGGAAYDNARGSDPRSNDGPQRRRSNGTAAATEEEAGQPNSDWADNITTVSTTATAAGSLIGGSLGMSERDVLTQIFSGPPSGAEAAGVGAASPEAQSRSEQVGSVMTATQDVIDALQPLITDGKTGGKGGKPKAGKSASKTIKGGTPASNKQLGQAMAGARGWSGRQWNDLLKLWMKESGWNHKAVNSSSGAAGIPQALPSAHPGVVTEAWMNDPAAQIQWGLNYIAGRYKTPAKAWQHSQRTGWYREGVWNVPQDEVATLHQGELVFSAREARKIRDVLTDTATTASPAAPASGQGTQFVFNERSIQLVVGQGASPATARTTARELFEEFERISREAAIAKGR